MRKPLAFAAAAALVTGLIALAGPAAATCDPLVGCVPVTFTVSGTISITAPSTAPTAPTSAAGGTLDIALGNTSVTDGRGGTLGWYLNATATDFTATGGLTITKSRAAFAVPSAPSASSGCTISLVSTTFVAVDPTTGTTVAPILRCVAIGSNSATYNPHVQITVPASAVAGSYTGTVTQSVS